MSTDSFDRALDALSATARASEDVVGLVAFGSTADRSRTDGGSDHDFAWLTVPGAEARYRSDISWLPDAHRVVLSVVEHHGGVKVVYDDGHRMEFGIATIDDFSGWAGAPTAVLYGEDAVAAAASTVAANRPPGSAMDTAVSLGLFATQLLAGIGRAARGEVLSARQLICGEAVEHLLRVLGTMLDGERSHLDRLDPRRRFERFSPQLGAEIDVACRLDPIAAAATLLTIAQRVGDVPAAQVVRSRIEGAIARPTV